MDPQAAYALIVPGFPAAYPGGHVSLNITLDSLPQLVISTSE